MNVDDIPYIQVEVDPNADCIEYVKIQIVRL